MTTQENISGWHVQHSTQMSGETENWHFKTRGQAQELFDALVGELKENEVHFDEEDIKTNKADYFHCDDGDYYHTVRILPVRF